jgi:hypothetical protein
MHDIAITGSPSFGKLSEIVLCGPACNVTKLDAYAKDPSDTR